MESVQLPPLTDEARSDAVLGAAGGLTIVEAENAFALSIVHCGHLDLLRIAAEKARAIRQSGLLEVIGRPASLDDIGGLDGLKAWLLRRVSSFDWAAQDYGLPAPKGLMIAGIPGTGKSLTAKATADALRLPLLDEHSRYNLLLEACSRETLGEVRLLLERAFTIHGLPAAILCDNGTPWGDAAGFFTKFEVWLLRLGVRVGHGRPCHLQTQGKEERFHRTLKAKVLSQTTGWRDLEHCQTSFQAWRRIYNHERPHEVLGGAVLMSRYRISERPMPKKLAPAGEWYGEGDVVKSQLQGHGFSARQFVGDRRSLQRRGDRAARSGRKPSRGLLLLEEAWSDGLRCGDRSVRKRLPATIRAGKEPENQAGWAALRGAECVNDVPEQV